jgi:hypothetical protein
MLCLSLTNILGVYIITISNIRSLFIKKSSSFVLDPKTLFKML